MDRLGGIVYHYGSYETTSIRKLIERYGLDPRAEALYDRLIDLEKVLKASVVLPLEGYSLKDIAPWLGFSWSADNYKADDSMISYLEFQADGDHAHLNNILTYNQDDLKATRMIRDWLLTLEG
jgi:uncharacterized protein